MKVPTTMWAAQAAEERRRLAEAGDPTPQERAQWAADGSNAGAEPGKRRLSRIVGRIRSAIRR